MVFFVKFPDAQSLSRGGVPSAVCLEPAAVHFVTPESAGLRVEGLVVPCVLLRDGDRRSASAARPRSTLALVTTSPRYSQNVGECPSRRPLGCSESDPGRVSAASAVVEAFAATARLRADFAILVQPAERGRAPAPCRTRVDARALCVPALPLLPRLQGVVVTFEANSWVWVPHDTEMFLPGKVQKSFKPGEEGTVKFEDGKVSSA